MGDNNDEIESMQLTHTKKRKNNSEGRGRVSSKVGWSKGLNQLLEQSAMEQLRKTSQNQADATSQQETPTAPDREGQGGRKEGRDRNGKSGKLNRVVGENRREHKEGVSRKELHGGSGWGGRGQNALINQPNWSSVTLSKMRKGEKKSP